MRQVHARTSTPWLRTAQLAAILLAAAYQHQATAQISLGQALDQPNWDWSTGGDAAWYGQSAVSHDGMHAAQSGAITHLQECWIEAEVEGPGEVQFWWKVSSEEIYDFLEFWVDDLRFEAISGEVDWVQVTHFVNAPLATLRWRYAKDGSLSSGSDCGWVDEVFYIQDTDLPLGQALDQPDWDWYIGGDAVWYGQSAVSHDGVDAAQSGAITDNQECWFEAEVEGPGEIQFWWKVSSEENFDFLEFWIDDSQVEAISGEVDWVQVTHTVDATLVSLRWRYVKDGSVSSGSDCGWVDQVAFTPIIRVSSIEELQLIGNDPDYPLDGYYQLTQDLDASDTATWNSGAGFQPIGSSSSPFTGVFDGQGHVISNLWINRPGENSVGLFSVLGGSGFLHGITLVDCTVTGGNATGGLLGGNQGLISGCAAAGTVTGGENVGGLVGRQSGTVSHSSATVETTGTYSVGGLVGFDSGTLQFSYASGAVTGDFAVGGLVGYADFGMIQECYAAGSVSGTYRVGGLAGRACSSGFYHSYAAGPVQGTDYVGGLIGLSYDEGEPPGVVVRSYSTALVTGSGFVGGLVGEAEPDSVFDSFWDVDTSGQTVGVQGEGLPTADMQTLNTFTEAGWNFVTIWDMLDGGSYPYLLHLPTSEVPGVVGADGPQAVADIEAAGLVPQVEYAYHRTAPEGTVINQSVAGGTTLNANLPVTIVVSMGPDILSIASIEALQMIGNDPDYPLDGYYQLTQDLDASATATWNSGAGFQPIGSDASPFTGVLDGQAYVITNLWINRPEEDHVGLLGVVGEDGLIENLSLEGCTVTGRTHAGALAGMLSPGSEVSQCNAEGAMSGASLVGGLVGLNAHGQISQCHATGAVTGETYVGGLVGANDGIVTHCSAHASVAGGDYAGGLVGVSAAYGDSTISRCHATGDVTGGSYIGGLVGSNGSVPGALGTVSECYATGRVVGDTYVGGLVGANFQTVSDSYATGSVSGEQVIGGLVGYLAGQNPPYAVGTVTRSYSTYQVSNRLGGDVGGLIGVNDGGTVENAYWDRDRSAVWQSDGGIGLYTIQMQALETFTSAGWDFENTWYMLSEGSYPYLGNLPQAAVPDISGLSEEDAIAALDAARLSAQHYYYETNETVPAGTVIRQYEPPGASINAGAPVFFVVSSGPEVMYLWTVEQLQMIGNDPDYPLDGYYVLAQDIDATETVTWNDGAGFDPIGTYVVGEPSQQLPFTGTFDGLGYVISGLTINRPSEGSVGLFRAVSSTGVVRNLGLYGGTVTGYSQIGSLVGVNFGTITDCHSTAAVFGDWDLGGLVGWNQYGGTLTRCHAAGTVTSEYSQVGGLIGSCHDAVVTECYATGAVHGDTNVGGLIGVVADTDVIDCFSSGPVTGMSQNIGGLIGQSSNSNVLASYAIGAVMGGYAFTGGLIGQNGDPTLVEASFWDLDTSGLGTSAGGEGLRTPLMQTLATFTAAEWDFETVWFMLDGWTYPYLRNLPQRVVPEVIVWTEAGAVAALEAAGLTASVTYLYSSEVPEGYVMGQDVPPGASLNAGVPVPITVSVGPEPVPVNFADPNLEAAVRAALGIPVEPLTSNDLAELYNLTAEESNIVDLSGLEYAVNLAYLNLNSNQIVDLSPLASLSALTALQLVYNHIADLGPLQELTNLQLLHLGGNEIADLEPLAGLTGLQSLHLWQNQIADLMPIAGLSNLYDLQLYGNQVVEIPDLSALTSLTYLHLGGNQIASLAPLAPLTQLTTLYVEQNEIASLDPLSGLANLTVLSASYNHIEDPAPLAGLTGLRWLDVAGNQITSLLPLQQLTELETLGAGWNQVSDLTPIAGLVNLRSLGLEGNGIEDIGPLSGLTQLENLSLSHNLISGLSPIAGLTLLTSLSLEVNEISDVSPLAGLSNLQYLSLSTNIISDLSPIAGLGQLQYLYAFDNQISSLAPLAGLVNLETLMIWSNSISDLSPLAGLTNLDSLHLGWNYITNISPLVVNAGLVEGAYIDLRGNPLSPAAFADDLPALASRGVVVQVDEEDFFAPVLTLLGDVVLIHEAGTPFHDPFATAYDNRDGDLTAEIFASDSIEPMRPGVYEIWYHVEDAAGNVASAIRTVQIVDTTPPVLTLSGPNPLVVVAGSPYIDPGATAYDLVDGDITEWISVESNVLPLVPGTYETVYLVADNAGNAAGPVTRIVVVLTGEPALQVYPPRPEVDWEGGVIQLYVDNAGTGIMPWTATLTQPVDWLTFIGPGSGQNSGMVEVEAAYNESSDARTATLRMEAPGSAGSPLDVVITQWGWRFGWVQGQVRDRLTRTALTCATVTAVPAGVQLKQDAAYVAVTDASGWYFLEELPEGVYYIEVISPGYQGQIAEIAVNSGEIVEQMFLLDAHSHTGVIAGRVTDGETGLPLAGVRVEAYAGGALIAVTYTCADGRYELLLPVKSTRVALKYVSPYHDEELIEIELIPGEPPPEVDAALNPKAMIPGSIVGVVMVQGTGRPLPNATVTVQNAGNQTVKTCPQGTFTVLVPDYRRYLVRASAHGFKGATISANVRSAAPVPLAFTLARIGDVSGDGLCDSVDVQLTINTVLGVPGNIEPALLDLNGDGRVNAQDLQIVINAVLLIY